MKNVENISIWRFGYNYVTCCRLIGVLLGFSCLTAVYADSQNVQTKIGDIYIQNNSLYCSNDKAEKSLTGSRLVGALYNASFDGRYVLYGGAKIEKGLLLPDLTLYVIDVQSKQITNLNEFYSLKVVGGSFASNSYDLALVNIDSRTLHIVDFEFGKIKKTFSLSRAQDLSFQPVWNAAGDRVAIYLTDCVDCKTFNLSGERNLSGWLIINVELQDKDNYENLPLVQKLSESPDFGQPFVQLESEEAGVNAVACVDSPNEVGGDIALRLPYQNGEQYRVSQGYCSDGGSHRGFEVDFAMATGTVVVATAPGVVIEGGANNPLHYDYPCDGISGNDQNGTNVRLLHQGSTKQWISYYLHLTYPRLTKAETIGAEFEAGEVIGYSGNTGCTTGPHLHFQMRNAINNGGNDGVRPTPMQGRDVDSGVNTILDFEYNHTYLAIDSPIESTFFWTGNGSIIRYHGRLLSSDAGIDWPYGISKDVTILHTSSGNPVGFFQWQVYNNGCGNLKIDAPDLSSNEKEVDITVGTWSSRDQDKTFANVQLPFTLGASNIGTTMKDGDWWVIAVAFKNKVSEDVRLDVDCTNETSTPASPIMSNLVTLEGGYKWNGNGSIISHLFRSLANSSVTSIDWPYGAFRDVTQVHPSSEKPVVFFQWQVWDSGCKQLTLDAPDLNATEKRVNIEVKGWASPCNNCPQKVFENVTLPFTINASNTGFVMSDGQWLVIKIEFINSVSMDARVEARCPGF